MHINAKIFNNVLEKFRSYDNHQIEFCRYNMRKRKTKIHISIFE